MINTSLIKKIYSLPLSFLTLIVLLFFVPQFVGATSHPDVVTLTNGIAGGINSGGDFGEYLNYLFLTIIGLGAVFAVIKIALAGIKYMLTDVVTSKGQAKDDIQGALLGLGIILATFLVLNTIYPGLVSLNVLDRYNGDIPIEGVGALEVDRPPVVTPPPETDPCTFGVLAGTDTCQMSDDVGPCAGKTGTALEVCNGSLAADKYICESDGNTWDYDTNTCDGG